MIVFRTLLVQKKTEESMPKSNTPRVSQRTSATFILPKESVARKANDGRKVP
jgi:hypothetical protein